MLRNASEAPVQQSYRRYPILPAQVRLLYANIDVAVFITVLAATILVRLQWGFIPNSTLIGWWTYMVVVSAARYASARRFRFVSPAAYAVGAGLAGAGWGAAGILLYASDHLRQQVFLVFVLGGMMFAGAASLLAPRPEAFLAFLLPAGLTPAVRLMMQGDETHLAMGLLAALFTGAVVVTTMRIYRTLESSLQLQFENGELLDDLRAAKSETETLNQQLELKVQERTAELHDSIHGAGLGAWHQTGWTALIADLILTLRR